MTCTSVFLSLMSTHLLKTVVKNHIFLSTTHVGGEKNQA